MDNFYIAPRRKIPNQVVGVDSMPSTVNHYFTEKGSFIDFGGNRGNAVFFECTPIQQDQYTAIDVVKGALDMGQAEFPTATFIHYNKFNPLYNKLGDTDAPLPNIDAHDFSFSFGYFVSVDYRELLSVVKWLWSKTKKRCVFSVLDKDHTFMLMEFYDSMVAKENDVFQRITAEFYRWYSTSHNIYYLKDNDIEIYDQEYIDFGSIQHDQFYGFTKSFITAYNLEWLKSQLEIELNCTVKIDKRNPANQMLSTVILDR